MSQVVMRALRLTLSNGPTPCLGLTALPKPTLPPNTVLVKIQAAGINPSDVLNANSGFHHTAFPRVPGRDYAGIVEAGPAEFVGQEVYAALALRRAMLQATDVVLVLGASGAVGSAACQLARSRGCRVLAATRHDTADVNLAADPELKAAKSLTDGKGPDVVVDTIGSLALMNAALLCLAPCGRLAYISAPRKGSTDFTFDLEQVYREEKVIIGCNSVLAELPETGIELKAMTAGFENGSLRAANEAELETIGIENAVDTYEIMRNGPGGKKFVIVF